MSSDYKLITKIEESLKEKGYTKIDRGLIVFGGKNNGTVDLKASKEDKTESIIIEIKSNPIHILDLSHFLMIKKNIESRKELQERLIFYLLTNERPINSALITIAKGRGIEIINIDEFISKKRFS